MGMLLAAIRQRTAEVRQVEVPHEHEVTDPATTPTGDDDSGQSHSHSSHWPALLWAWLRVFLALPWYGAAWLVVAGVALVWFGGRAGWRDMRGFTGEDD